MLVDEIELEFNKLENLMIKVLDNLNRRFSGLQICFTSLSELDSISIIAYGTKTKISNVASLSIEPYFIRIRVWDLNLTRNVEEAICLSSLGLKPQIEGVGVIRIPVPKPSQDRRKEMVRVASQHSERSRIFIRHIRQNGITSLKKFVKKYNIGIDYQRKLLDRIQGLSDTFIKKIDTFLNEKEREIMNG